MLAVGLLGYQLLAAMVFAARAYRVPWDFLLALLAAGALTDPTRRKRIE